MGNSGTTICKGGSLMTCVSMVIDGETPHKLNQWLKEHGGYVQGDVFVWTSVAPFGLSYLGQIVNHVDMRSHLDKGHIVILNIHNSDHWVLATNYSSNLFYV